jgi:hypothetical protein|nr:MAG: hypothetical protein DIU52_10525 [bacterium]
MGGVGRKGGGAGGRFTIAGLLILICGVRLFGGVAMLLKGAAVTNEVLAGDLSVRALGLLMMSIAGVGLRAGVGLFTKPERWWRVGVWATIALWVDGLLNGLVLFGAPRVGGQVLNTIVAMVLISSLVLVGRRTRGEGLPESV